MFLGRVIGTVWATQKEPRLEGLKLQVVREVDLDLKPQGRFVVAVDVVQAGMGEIVLVSTGSAARQAPQVEKRPVDALIMAVVDNLEFQSCEALQDAYHARADPLVAEIERQPEA